MKKIYTGSKFFRYIDGEDKPDIIRILKADKNKVRYIDSSNNKNIMPLDELLKNYNMLKADGIIMFSIVSIGDVDDVIVSLNKFNSDDKLPYAICRQSIFDFFSNIMKKSYDINDTVYVGVSASKDTCPVNIDFKDLLCCQSIEYNKPVAIYLDDTLDKILSLFRHEKFNSTLKTLEIASKNNIKDKITLGYNKTLRQLLINNNFMYDFRKCFDIVELPFEIFDDKEYLSEANILFLENEMKINITQTYVIEYSKEIDLKSIKRDYILATSAIDGYSRIYIVGYDKSSYVYTPRSI